MFDSQFSVINWALSRLGLIGGYGSESWPIWLGQPGLALLSVMFVNVWRGFPFSAIVLMAGMTSVSPEIVEAAKVDGANFLQRFRLVIVPMIAPILFIGTAFDAVFTLSDLSIVYLLTNGGPDGATGDPPHPRLQHRHPGRGPRAGARRYRAVPLPAAATSDGPPVAHPATEAVAMGAMAAAVPRSHRAKEIRRHALIYLGLTPFLVIAIFPLFWMLITALKQDPDLYRMDAVPFWFHLPPPGETSTSSSATPTSEAGWSTRCRSRSGCRPSPC